MNKYFETCLFIEAVSMILSTIIIAIGIYVFKLPLTMETAYGAYATNILFAIIYPLVIK